MVAMPQAAMAQSGSSSSTRRNAFSPSCHQNECGSPTESLAKSAKTGQTGAPFNAGSEVHLGTPDSRDSLPDAGDPAKEEKGEEGLGRDGQAGEEGEKAERAEGRRGRPEIPLAAQSSDTPSSLAIAIITGPSSRYRPTNSSGVVGFSMSPKVS